MPPDIKPECADLYEAFLECGSDRQFGMGVGPIPFSSIDRYASRNGFDSPEAFAFLTRMLRAMDAEYQRAVARLNKSKR